MIHDIVPSSRHRRLKEPSISCMYSRHFPFLSYAQRVHHSIILVLNVFHLISSLTSVGGKCWSPPVDSHLLAFFILGVWSADNQPVSVCTIGRLRSADYGAMRSLTTILVSRFLLDLQEASQSTVQLDPGDTPQTSIGSVESATFAQRAVGSVGSVPADDGGGEDACRTSDSQHADLDFDVGGGSRILRGGELAEV